MAKHIRVPSVWKLECKVVGVTHKNSDGTSRADIIKNNLEIGDHVLLVPEPENEYDSNAIRVTTSNHLQLGYIAKKDLSKIKPVLDIGNYAYGKVIWIGDGDFPGVRISVELANF